MKIRLDSGSNREEVHPLLWRHQLRVTQRTQEIGIRIALGAQRAQVLRLIIGQGLRISLIGVGLGLIAAFGLAQLVSSQLFGVTAFDPATFTFMAILLGIVALLRATFQRDVRHA